MAPIDPQLRPPIRVPRAHHLQIDIDVAARRAVPVLISAQPGCAAIIVQAIAARSHRDVIPVSPPKPAATDDVITTIAEKRLGIRTPRGAILWLKQVHELSAAHQAAVIRLLDAAAAAQPQQLRVVASSSADLLDRVESGSFDGHLFYRLNAIHLVVDDTIV
jgi:Sigma-54 interaction domain